MEESLNVAKKTGRLNMSVNANPFLNITVRSLSRKERKLSQKKGQDGISPTKVNHTNLGGDLSTPTSI